MDQTRALSKLLESLYATALSDSHWPAFLNQLCDLTGSATGFLFSNDSTLGNRSLASGGEMLPIPYRLEYSRNFSYSDPFRKAFMVRPRTGVIEYEELVPHAELVKTQIYITQMAPLGLTYGTCIIPSVSPRSYELISIVRTGRPFLEPDRKELLHLLLPHFRNVLKIRRAVGRAQARARNAEAMLDGTSTASILLDDRGNILFMNHAAQALALVADGFRVRDDRIQPLDPAERASFDALVTASAADRLNPGGAITLARPAGRPLQLLVSPFHVDETARSSARVLILATDPDQAVSFPDAILRQLYDLTPAETEIANGLLTGFSLEEIAALRNVTRTTVRSQLKSILAKTSTRRQADLVRLLATLPKPAINPSD